MSVCPNDAWISAQLPDRKIGGGGMYPHATPPPLADTPMKSYKSKEKSYKKELQKQRKSNGNAGEIYNLITYVRCDHGTQDKKPQCVLLRFWHLNQPIF
jgi:hypothetical protein